MRKPSQTLTAFALLASLVGGGAAASAWSQAAFPDVNPRDWDAAAIQRLSARQVILGYGDGSFRPQQSATRAEFATLLSKAFNAPALPQPVAAGPRFADVPSDYWARNNIQTVAQAGWMVGCTPEQFFPADAVSRAQAITAVTQAMGVGRVSQGFAQQILSRYPDGNQVPSWAQIPVATALHTGLLNNEPGIQNALRPNVPVTRGEITSLLANARVMIGVDPPLQGSTATALAPNMMLRPVAQGSGVFPLQGETQLQPPTVNVVFQDTIDPATAQPGDAFRVVTQAPLRINQDLYPAGTVMAGQIIAVQRPTATDPGRVQMVFTGVQGPNGQLAAFARPEEVQATAAFAAKCNQESLVSRGIQAPFRIGGGAVEAVGSTAGSVLHEVGSFTGGMLRNVGGALVDFVTLKPAAGIEKTGDALIGPLQGVANVVGTTATGGKQVIQLSTGEVLYVADPAGRPMGQEPIRAGDVVPITFVQTNIQPAQ